MKTLFVIVVAIFAIAASWCANQWFTETLVVLLVLAVIEFAVGAYMTQPTSTESDSSDNWIDVEDSIETDTADDDRPVDTSMPESLRKELIALKYEMMQADLEKQLRELHPSWSNANITAKAVRILYLGDVIE